MGQWRLGGGEAESADTWTHPVQNIPATPPLTHERIPRTGRTGDVLLSALLHKPKARRLWGRGCGNRGSGTGTVGTGTGDGDCGDRDCGNRDCGDRDCGDRDCGRDLRK